MESTDEEISEASFEFSEEELLEAIKKKGGRPSNRTREIRARINEANKLRDILGIINSGILERIDEFVDKPSGFDSERGNIRETVKPDDNKRAEGVIEELLIKSGLFNKKVITQNKQIINLLDEMTSNAVITYGPAVITIVGAVVAMWLAEENIKGFPPVLHTLFNILSMLLPLMDTLINTMVWWADLAPLDIVKTALETIEEARAPFQNVRNTMTISLTHFFMNTVYTLFNIKKSETEEGIQEEQEITRELKTLQDILNAEPTEQAKQRVRDAQDLLLDAQARNKQRITKSIKKTSERF